MFTNCGRGLAASNVGVSSKLLVRLRSKLANSGGSIGDFRHNLWKFKYKLADSDSESNIKPERDRSPFYITTPIYYVNGDPHIGHAYTSVVCDVISRFHRLDGREVWFLTGTDEHGQKVEKSALKAGKDPSIFADEMSAKFRDLTKKLNCSNDDFIRTTEHRHMKATEAVWKMLESNGDIYLGHYEGWYSLRDEAFYAEKELVNGKAPTGADVEWVREESYFFRLSNYTDKLLNYYSENRSFILPFNKRNEIIGFLKQEGGLTDLSISRTTFSWGIKVPNNSKHVIYVWLDALINYISALGYPYDNNSSSSSSSSNDNISNISNNKSLYDKFWPANVHVVGKDILKFHSIYWPAFLMSLGIPLPKTVFAHGWWTKDGEKMSKSLGNVIDPLPLIDQYGVDYLRYFLTTDIVFGGDGDFNKKSFTNKLNADLVNEVGNLVQRVLVFTLKNCDGRVPYPSTIHLSEEDLDLMGRGQVVLDSMRDSMNSFDVKSAVEQILIIPRLCNKYLTVNQPWFLIDTNVKKMNTVLYVMIESIRQISILLEPIIPLSSAKIQDQLNVPDNMRTFESLGMRIAPGTALGDINHIFPRIIAKKDDYLKEDVNNLSALNEVRSELNKVGNKTKSSSNSNTATDIGARDINGKTDNGAKAKKSKTKADALLMEEYMTYPIERILILIEEVGHEIRLQKSERNSKETEIKNVESSPEEFIRKEKVNPNVETSNLNRNIMQLLALKECYKIKKDKLSATE